jgi:twitching motility two-component system response regulator PilH
LGDAPSGPKITLVFARMSDGPAGPPPLAWFRLERTLGADIMKDPRETGPQGREIEDAVRHVERHRTMLTELIEVQLRTLRELKVLGAGSGGDRLPAAPGLDVDAEIHRTSEAGRLLAAGPAAGKRAVPRVLLIDDDPTTRNIISHFLRKEEFIVEKAADGADGLDRAQKGKPDLLIIDAVVPGMDGFEILSLLRKDPETASIPVLMLSTLGEEAAIVKGLEEGADYIIKPFSPQILVATVRKILKERCDRALDRRPL